ncbi:hypothetical protein D3C84_723600 [compost metagenome]
MHVLQRQLLVLLSGPARNLLDQHPEAQFELPGANRHVAVEQDRFDGQSLVFGAHSGEVGGRPVIGRLRHQVAPKALGVAMELLGADMALEGIAEVLGRCAMHRAKMLGIDQIVHQLARMGVDDHQIQMPIVIPLVAVDFREIGNLDTLGRRLPLGVVPDEQQAVDLAGQPFACLGLGRNALAIGNLGAATTGIEGPMMERADHLAIDQLALRQVRPHVRAVRVQHGDLLVLAEKGQQPGAEDIQRMQLAVAIGLGLAKAVPATGIAILRRFLHQLDLNHLIHESDPQLSFL